MEGSATTHDMNLASRKAEEAAWRRFQAAGWLETLVGPIGVSTHPSEREFVSCLRNGLILCNAINKIHPGSVPKIVENHSSSQSLTWESQPLPAYQYFENVRNFLVAVEELKLPAFEASDLERDTLEAGSAAKVVDCILVLKSYHEWKQMGGGNGYYKHVRSPMVVHSANRVNSTASAANPSDSCRRLDMSVTPPLDGEARKLEDLIVSVFAECMVDVKENIDDNLLDSFRSGNRDPIKLLSRVMMGSLKEQLENKFPEMKPIFKDLLQEGSDSNVHSKSTPLENSSTVVNSKHCRACLKKNSCNHLLIFQMQEKELSDLKALLSRTKREFKGLESQLQNDLKQLGNVVQEMSAAAVGYQRVVKENRNLYNMVQDLKGAYILPELEKLSPGNIRVYCRIRPAFSVGARSTIDFIGEDGSLVIVDPLKRQRDGRRVFQFDRVFDPTATQDAVFKDTQPLIRSVMDGYNVCIFAYGQTGSGKTYTMCGPSGGSTKDMGINYLALNDLFQMSNKRKDIITYDIYVQMVEIYNEQVRDLLAEDSSTTKYPFLMAVLSSTSDHHCTSENGLSLPDATVHSVKSTADVLNLMKLGELNRHVSSTAINNRSSRSHSVLTIHVHGNDLSGSILRSCLHLVDLAGSERVDKSEVTGDRLKEAQYINKSLSCLGDVITALAQKNSHIPYRNSKLTLLLQDSLEDDSFGETISTLKFAQRVSTVELGTARLNKESSKVMELKEQIENLKKALSNKEGHSIIPSKVNEPRPPSEKPKGMIDRTPPRPRRLSIENCSSLKKEKAMHPEEKKGSKTPSIRTRARRLSLEGSNQGKKDHLLVKMSEDVSKLQPLEAFGHFSTGSSMMEEEVFNYQKAPKSPTPEPDRKEVQTMMQSDLSVSKDSQIPSFISSGNGKGSQIRKSLRTIGKLINGSEKRNQQKLMEARTPIKGSNNAEGGRSPLTANARAMRRQSLTGIQTSGPWRSSVIGKSSDSCK
ncbi:Kinesin-like protein KIN-14L [Vitis vinifera]|uniref:Kinesin-like protein KIN-14L n=1 Tax=Vitis vinifera TaxID=29760 RepID=A0A438JL05_VITVI|nr:Kinesin-like protein KIN-14L [Vitis vinifera]